MNKDREEWSWVMARPLREVVKRIDDLSYSEPTLVSSDVLAMFARRLVAAEIQPAGPYMNEQGEVEPSLNRAIALLFIRWGRPLPSLEKYLVPGDIRSRRRAMLKPLMGVRAYKARHMSIARYMYAQNNHEYAWMHGLGEQVIEGVVKVDAMRYEISGIVYDWHRMIESSATSGQLRQLSRANMMLWAAYTLFDDLIDDEPNALNYLSVANVYHRRAYMMYRSVAATTAQKKLVDDTFMRMDRANHYERARLRIPIAHGALVIPGSIPRVTDQFIADRAAGHILGPLLLLSRQAKHSRDFQQWCHALEDYLVVRQLCDDLHDWRDDIASGRMTQCSRQLLKDAAIASGAQKVSDVQRACKDVFWSSTLEALSVKYLQKTVTIETTVRKFSRDVNAAEMLIQRVLQPLKETLEMGQRVAADQRRFIAEYSR